MIRFYEMHAFFVCNLGVPNTWVVFSTLDSYQRFNPIFYGAFLFFMFLMQDLVRSWVNKQQYSKEDSDKSGYLFIYLLFLTDKQTCGKMETEMHSQIESYILLTLYERQVLTRFSACLFLYSSFFFCNLHL